MIVSYPSHSQLYHHTIYPHNIRHLLHHQPDLQQCPHIHLHLLKQEALTSHPKQVLVQHPNLTLLPGQPPLIHQQHYHHLAVPLQLQQLTLTQQETHSQLHQPHYHPLAVILILRQLSLLLPQQLSHSQPLFLQQPNHHLLVVLLYLLQLVTVSLAPLQIKQMSDQERDPTLLTPNNHFQCILQKDVPSSTPQFQMPGFQEESLLLQPSYSLQEVSGSLLFSLSKTFPSLENSQQENQNQPVIRFLPQHPLSHQSLLPL